MKHDILIVGAGITGCTLAERFASIGKKVLLIEQRNFLGGNCYDYIDTAGILVPKYGPHFFHTNDKMVWEYVQKFTEWIPYQHKVLSHVDDTLVPIPVNITTINILFNENLKTEHDMKQWLSKQVVSIINPKNSEESALSRFGPVLYEKMFKYYTKKQWDVLPKDLDPSVMDRIPIRTNFDDRYFSDTYQAMPKDGYTKMFEKMVCSKNITIQLNTEYFPDHFSSHEFESIFFTGRIDHYFASESEKLQYRSLRFEFETHDVAQYQDVTSINYPQLNVPFTRITEPKHSTHQINSKTTIIKEYPTWVGEPYYPVLSNENKNRYEKYKLKAKSLESKGVYFVGRLAEYKYFNMDQAFKNALDLFFDLEKK